MTSAMERVAASAMAAFDEWVPQIEQWEASTAALVVSGPEDQEAMGRARESRLGLRRVRINIENRRKELKEESLRRGQEIDRCANGLKARIEPLEAKLLMAEETAERHERAGAETRRRARHLELEAIDPGAAWMAIFPGDALGKMADGAYAMVVDGAKASVARRAEEARKAEVERAAKAKAEAEAAEALRVEAARLEQERAERERVQAAENARLKEEAAAREAGAKAERDLVEAERAKEREEAESERKAEQARMREREEKRVAEERQQREAAEATAKKEREAREKAELELRQQKEAEAAKKKAAEDAARRAAAAPDREKLLAWGAALEEHSRQRPHMDTPEGKALVARLAEQVRSLAVLAQDSADDLGSS